MDEGSRRHTPSWASPLTSQGPPHTSYSMAHSPHQSPGVFTDLGVRLEEVELHPPRASSLLGTAETAMGGPRGRKDLGHAPLGYFRLRAIRQVPAWFHFLFYEMNKYAFLVSNIITLGPSTPATCLIGELSFGSPEAEQDLGESQPALGVGGELTHPQAPPRPPWVPSSSSLTGPHQSSPLAHLQHCPLPTCCQKNSTGPPRL